MGTDPEKIEPARRRKDRTLEQIKQYEEHLDRLDAEKKEKTGTIAGKKAKILPSSASISGSGSPLQELFSKILKAP